jgi:two-component system OmpR family sensor kinase
LSRTNDSGISLAENRTFRAFVILYALMSVMILALLGSLYYLYKKDQMLSSHRLAMQLQSETYVPRLKRWMQGDDALFPIDLAYRTGLYDDYYNPIHTTLKEPSISWKEGVSLDKGRIHFVIPLASYEVGNQYLVIETDDDGLWRQEFLAVLLGVGTPLMVLLMGVGWILARLFLRPMNEAIALLDRFIKDTTHELNTPVSAILSNVEVIDVDTLEPSLAKKVNRISIAAKTISTIYDDLTYLILNHAVAVDNRPLELRQLIRERLEYFQTRYDQRRIRVEVTAEAEVWLMIDRNKAVRLIDNLLSNAIKYNNPGGSIMITLEHDCLQVSDTGRGIDPEKIEQIFERYKRVDESVGGFGIGLHIVAMIAQEYAMAIDVSSTPGEGTTIDVRWPQDLLTA